jgi:MoxR-like ATPase
MINTFNIHSEKEYKSAGPNDLIALIPVNGSNQLFIAKNILEMLTYGITHNEFIHLSGPTGSAKSSLIEALARKSDNFEWLCKYLGYPFKPLQVYEIEMAIFDTPAELYQRRSLNEKGTYDEESILVKAIKEAIKKSDDHYTFIFLKEMGRVHSASIQGGLLNLMTKSDIVLPSEEVLPGGKVSFIADSNYQSMEDAQHTLVTLDDALKRRFSINIMLDYLSELEEGAVVHHLLKQKNGTKKIDEELIGNIVKLGHLIRHYRTEGNLLSVVAPTIYGYLTCYEMAEALPHTGIQAIVSNTMLGNASKDDQRMVDTLIQNVFHMPIQSKKESIFNDVF